MKRVHNSTVFENHKKVAFKIASEASYVYILSWQKFIKSAQKTVNFGEFLKAWRFIRKVDLKLNRTKMPKLKIEMRHFERFSNTVYTFRQSIHENSNFRFLVSKALKIDNYLNE